MQYCTVNSKNSPREKSPAEFYQKKQKTQGKKNGRKNTCSNINKFKKNPLKKARFPENLVNQNNIIPHNPKNNKKPLKGPDTVYKYYTEKNGKPFNKEP